MSTIAGLHPTGDDRIATGGANPGSGEGIGVADRARGQFVEIRSRDEPLSIGTQVRTHILHRKPEDVGAFGLRPNSGTLYQDQQ